MTRRLYIILALLFTAACRESALPPVPAAVAPVVATLAPVATLPPPPPTPPVTPRLTATTIAATLVPTVGVSPPPARAEPAGTPIVTPAAAVTPTVGPTAAATSPLAPIRVVAAPGVPAGVRLAVQLEAQRLPEVLAWVEWDGPASGSANVLLSLEAGATFAEWTYVPVAPFATVEDGISLAELKALWQAGPGHDFTLDADTSAALTALWGAPAALPDTSPAETLVSDLWQRRPERAVVPFEGLVPELKLLHLDGASPLAPDFNQDDYPLQIEVSVSGDPDAVAAFLEHWPTPLRNFDPRLMTRIAMTGVTALTRATAFQMELNGVGYPGTDVAPILNAADIAHVSNEVAFAPDCPYPDPFGGTTFCSHDKYFDLLRQLGVDVVEVTGNHVNDWGAESFLHSLDMYEASGMQYFGGGRDLADAASPALFNHNGNRIAFLGCNPVGPAYAYATTVSAGSMPCSDAFAEQIRQLNADGYVVLATLQYQEYYAYPPVSSQSQDFQAVAEAGAAVVSGSQGHHAQGFAFHDGRFVHYGLGNLFFDQMELLGTRQSFVDTHTVYAGKLINVSLWTGLIENYARPRPMTADERRQLLETVFAASGW